MKTKGSVLFFLCVVMLFSQQKFEYYPPDNFILDTSQKSEVVYKNAAAGAVIQIKEIQGLPAQKALDGFSTLQFSKNSSNFLEEISLNMQQKDLVGKVYVSQFFIQEKEPYEMYRLLAILGNASTTYYISVTMPSLSFKVLKDPILESLQSFHINF
jgi:hypothetical protein